MRTTGGSPKSKRQYELTGKRPRLGELKSQLVRLTQSEALWLYEVSAHIGQPALKDLNVAFERCCRGLKGEGPKRGYPKFKKKGRARLGPVVRGHARGAAAADAEHRTGSLEGTRTSRRFEGRILSATITRRADRWFVSLCVERQREIFLPKPVVRPSDVVGVDLDLKSGAFIYDGASSVESAP
jgi:putative transposase